MSLLPVPDDHLATVVTSLEMVRAPLPAPLPAQMPPSVLSLRRWKSPERERYRALFRRVGAPWLWFSRLVMEDAALDAILSDPRVEIHAVTNRAGVELGMLELDFREEGACEIAFLGLVPEMTGRGHGRWLMHHALALGWRPGVTRMWVHSCTLDHPAALDFYRASGFRPFRRQVEIFTDPRRIGILPPDAAPQILLLP